VDNGNISYARLIAAKVPSCKCTIIFVTANFGSTPASANEQQLIPHSFILILFNLVLDLLISLLIYLFNSVLKLLFCWSTVAF
jgi:hypothetical protein